MMIIFERIKNIGFQKKSVKKANLFINPFASPIFVQNILKK
jgi:hypothetical protein